MVAGKELVRCVCFETLVESLSTPIEEDRFHAMGMDLSSCLRYLECLDTIQAEIFVKRVDELQMGISEALISVKRRIADERDSFNKSYVLHRRQRFLRGAQYVKRVRSLIVAYV
ncbi:hypothetical protein Y032_0030g2063 [Ancylostoma ceylanicum]|uniref:Uncharacterized protein n=1 Tax=Ancylostoma ceylanicum TaxID=53326 RepID=A0A016URC1_9BILA|nr:hypothetical protein Y032_0030g2063 [Ancylostoma ceylanicum]